MSSIHSLAAMPSVYVVLDHQLHQHAITLGSDNPQEQDTITLDTEYERLDLLVLSPSVAPDASGAHGMPRVDLLV